MLSDEERRQIEREDFDRDMRDSVKHFSAKGKPRDAAPPIQQIERRDELRGMYRDLVAGAIADAVLNFCGHVGIPNEDGHCRDCEKIIQEATDNVIASVKSQDATANPIEREAVERGAQEMYELFMERDNKKHFATPEDWWNEVLHLKGGAAAPKSEDAK